MRRVFAFVLLLAFVAPSALSAGCDVPYLTGRVVDNAEVLSSETAARVTSILKAHEDRTTDQVAVLTVRSLGGESIEEYAVAAFESWKLGQKGKGGRAAAAAREAGNALARPR